MRCVLSIESASSPVTKVTRSATRDAFDPFHQLEPTLLPSQTSRKMAAGSCKVICFASSIDRACLVTATLDHRLGAADRLLVIDIGSDASRLFRLQGGSDMSAGWRSSAWTVLLGVDGHTGDWPGCVARAYWACSTSTSGAAERSSPVWPTTEGSVSRSPGARRAGASVCTNLAAGAQYLPQYLERGRWTSRGGSATAPFLRSRRYPLDAVFSTYDAMPRLRTSDTRTSATARSTGAKQLVADQGAPSTS